MLKLIMIHLPNNNLLKNIYDLLRIFKSKIKFNYN